MTGPMSVSSTRPAPNCELKSASVSPSNTEPFSSQPPGEDRAAEEIGQPSDLPQVTDRSEQHVIAAVLADGEGVETKRPAEAELLGGQRLVVERRAGGDHDEHPAVPADRPERRHRSLDLRQTLVGPARHPATSGVVETARLREQAPSLRRHDGTVLAIALPHDVGDAFGPAQSRQTGIARANIGRQVADVDAASNFADPG